MSGWYEKLLQKRLRTVSIGTSVCFSIVALHHIYGLIIEQLQAHMLGPNKLEVILLLHIFAQHSVHRIWQCFLTGQAKHPSVIMLVFAFECPSVTAQAWPA